MRPWNRCVALASVLAVAGCVTYHPAPLAPAKTAADFEARSLASIGLHSFVKKNLPTVPTDWPPPQFDLATLTLIAFYFNPDLDIARAQWGVSTAGVSTAGARPNPTLSAAPGYDVNALSGVTPWIAAINLDIPIETAGKRGYRLARAQHLSESARLNLASAAWKVRSDLRASLVEWLIAQQRAALLARQRDLQGKIVARFEQRLTAGAVAQTDVTAARIVLSKLVTELDDAKTESINARARLAHALGLPSRALDAVQISFDFTRLPTVADELASLEIRRDGLRDRTDIVASLAEYAAAQSALQLEIAKQYPDLHLNPGYQYDQADNKWSLGLTLELPIFNRNQGPIAEAKARRAEAAARFVALQARVISEIDRALAAYRLALEQVVAAEALSSAQQNQLRAAEQQQQAGAIDSLELLGVQIESATSERARLAALLKAQQALGALEDAVQRPADAMNWAARDFRQNPRTKEGKP